MTTTDPNVHRYRVPDVSCGHCVAALESAVGPVDGVTGVEVDLDAKTVTVTGGDDTKIRAAVDGAGYDILD